MVQAKVEITLHDRSLVQVSRTDSGTLYIEVYGPGHAKDGHGMLLRGSTLLSEADRRGLLELLASADRDWLDALAVSANCGKRSANSEEKQPECGQLAPRASPPCNR